MSFGVGFGWGLDSAFYLAAVAYAPESGITMTVRTDSPGVQFYTGNYLNGSLRGKDGANYPRYSGFCLETQIFPDAINHPDFPSCIVEKGVPQMFFTEYGFSV